MIVYEYASRDTFGLSAKARAKHQVKAKPVSSADAARLKGFVEYLAGKKPEGKERVGTIKWGCLEFYVTVRDPKDPTPSHGVILYV